MSVYIGSPRREVQNCAGGRQLQANKKVNELFLAPCHLYIIERAKLWMYIINCTNLITMDHDANLPTSNSRQLEIRLRVEPRLMGNFCLSSPPNHHRLQRNLGLRGSWTYVERWRWPVDHVKIHQNSIFSCAEMVDQEVPDYLQFGAQMEST